MATYFSDSIRNTTFTANDLGSLLDSLACGIETWGGVSGGSANAQTITVSPTPVAYAAGQTFSFYATYTNTGSATLNVNSLGAITIYDSRTGIALTGNEIFATGVFTVVYYNTKFYLINGRDQEQTWSPTLVGFSANPTSTVYKYYKSGNIVTCVVRQGGLGTSNATNFTISLPFTAATISSGYWGAMIWDWTDNGVTGTVAGIATIASAGTVMTLYKGVGSTAWTAAGTKGANLTITYEAA